MGLPKYRNFYVMQTFLKVCESFIRQENQFRIQMRST